MRKLLCFLYAFVFSIGCSEKAPKVSADIDDCAHCNMVISKVNEACGYFHNDEFFTFDSPSCLISRMDAEKLKHERIYFANYKSGTLIPSDSTIFLLSDHITTVMNGRVLCFADKNAAQTLVKYDDELITDWTGYRVARGTPNKILKITLSGDRIIPQVVAANKNDIIEWKISGQNLQNDLVLFLRGYEDRGEIIVPASGEATSFRMLVDKPGDGFAIVRQKDQIALGMLKVIGAHTSDEEAM